MNYNMPLFRPPAEGNSLILQITIGCSQNSCGFCSMYKTKKFKIRPLQEILSEITTISVSHRKSVKRIFLADGDALIYPQKSLLLLLEFLLEFFPNLLRVSTYASANSLKGKSLEELQELKNRKMRVFYFGLESGDSATLSLTDKGFTAEEMLELCSKAQASGIRISVTAILGLAGKNRSLQHATQTAKWINKLSPRYFSLLTLFNVNNEAYLSKIIPLTNGEILEEALTLVRNLHPKSTIIRSNHVSNSLNLAGSYPKDRQKIIDQAEHALKDARKHPRWFNETVKEGHEFY